MARPRGPRSPLPGEQLIDGMFKRLGLLDQARAWRAMSAWREAAGPQVATRARAERLRGGTLFVRVASAAWAHELGFLKAKLIQSLRAQPGGETVSEIRFTVGPLGDAPDFGEPAPEPVPVAAPAAPRAREAAAPDAVDALRDVGDPELRARLARLLNIA